MKKYWLIIVGIFAFMNLNAQGLPMDEESDNRYEKLPRQPDFNDGGKSEDKALAGKTQWSLKSYCPKPKHQGTTGTCVGWAVGYAALTIQQAVENGWKGQTDLITDNAFSPMFIYNQVKISDCMKGAYVDAAMTLLQTKGDLSAADFDKNIADCNVMPTDKQLAKAAKNKITDFRTLFSYNASKQIKINKIKLSLIQNRPVVVGISLLKNFASITKAAPYWNPTKGNQGPYGGHSLVVIGFDDSRGAFEVMNSWGETWGNKGFAWIRYADFSKYCRYGFQMSLQTVIKAPKKYAGQFSLRRFEALMTSGVALFSEEKVQFNQGIYQLKKQDITTGTVFQLLVSQTTADTYLYAIGLEPDGQVKNYWPKRNESALLPFAEIDVFIPGSDAGLQFSQAGVEHLVILFSDQPIVDLSSNMKIISKMEGTIMDRLKAVFGKDLLLPKDINYDKMTMKFANELPYGHIIPMVLQLEIRL